MEIRKRLACAGVGVVLAGCLAAGGAIAAFADDASAASDGEATSAQYEDTRIGNNIGYGENGGTTLSNYSEYADKLTYAEKVAKNAEENTPKRYEDALGNVYQPVPSDPKGWNISYLNADERGCLSCHKSFEDICMSLDTKHNVYASGYAAQITIANCLGCHRNAGFGNTQLSVSLHGIHNGSAAFGAMNGTCDSCHYFSDGQNTVGENQFELWDFAKYDLYKGVTKVAAEDADVELSYDQDTVSANDQIFFESLNNEPSEWRTTCDPQVADDWIVSIGGEVQNPIEMSVTELKEKFGTKTFTMKQPCIENGIGGPWIYQAELTGISMKDIIDYVQPSDTVTNIKCTSEDGYNMVSPAFANVNVEDCLLVTEINGEPLPTTQGWPLTLAVPRNSAASYIKCIQTIDFVTKEGGSHDELSSASTPLDPHAGTMQGKPNAGVLNYPDGVVLPAGEPVHLEGYADAYDGSVDSVQYSLDGGKSWLEMDTPDNDPTRWTYWRMDFTPENPGAYLLKIRVTGTDVDGSALESSRVTNFLFTVE